MGQKGLMTDIVILMVIISLLNIFFSSDSLSISVSSRSGDPGLTIDLNISTPYKHHDFSFYIKKGEHDVIKSMNLIDLQNDGIKEMIIEMWNYTLILNSWNLQKEMWIIQDPFNSDNTSESVIIKWIVHDNKTSPVIVDIGSDKKQDMVLFFKGNQSRNGVVEVHRFQDGSLDPWPNCSFSINVSNEQNGTIASVQAIDFNGDISNDLVVHKEISYVYADPLDKTNHTKSKKIALILNGSKSVFGSNDENVFDTRLMGEWTPGYENDSYSGTFNTFFTGSINRIMGFDRQYFIQGNGQPFGRVFLMKNLDFSNERFFLKGNITDELIGDIIGSAAPIRFLNPYRDDLLIVKDSIGVFPGERFSGKKSGVTLDDLLIYTDGNSGITERFYSGDFNGDAINDLFCICPDNTISTRTNCGTVQIRFNTTSLKGIFKISDVQDITVLGPESGSFIGRKPLSYFFAEDINSDGITDIVISTWKGIVYVISGKPLENPIIEKIIPLRKEVYRGELLPLEVFGRDPQNMPKYLHYDLQIRIGSGEWFIPPIKKVENNFTYDDPYTGSMIFYLQIPIDCNIGPIGLKVRVTNTFNLSSEWYQYSSIADVINSPPVIAEFWLEKTVLRRMENLNVTALLNDIDDTGKFFLSIYIDYGSQQKKVYEGLVEKDIRFTISVPLNRTYPVNKQYKVSVETKDPSGGIGLSGPNYFFIEPDLLFFEITDIGPVFRGDDIIIGYSLITEMNNAEFVVNSSHLINQRFTLTESLGKMNFSIPIHSEVGLFKGHFIVHDGYWNITGTFDYEVLNNPPFIKLPKVFYVNGSGSISISSMIGDREDGNNIDISIDNSNDGITVVLDRDTQTLLFEMHCDGSFIISVKLTDKDGASCIDYIKIIGRGNKSSINPLLRIEVKDPWGGVVEGALVTFFNNGSMLSANLTSANGTAYLEVIGTGPFYIEVTPPVNRTWVEGERSGFLKKKLMVIVPPDHITIILEWRNISKPGFGSLIVLVMDKGGKPVPDAEVTIEGPKRYYDITNNFGEVIFIDIEPGKYTIVAEHDKMKGTSDATVLNGSEDRVIIILKRSNDVQNNIRWLYYLFLFSMVLGMVFLFLFIISRKRKEREEE